MPTHVTEYTKTPTAALKSANECYNITVRNTLKRKRNIQILTFFSCMAVEMDLWKNAKPVKR